MKFVTGLASALLLVSMMIAPNSALAEGWRIKSDFDTTTAKECQRKAKKALKGIAGVLQAPGKSVVYGYDLDGQNPYDAIIICHPEASNNKKFAVIVVVYDTLDTKKSRRKRDRYVKKILNRYFDQ